MYMTARRRSQVNAPRDIQVDAHTRHLSDAETLAADTLFYDIAEAVRARRLHMTDDFRDFDRVKRGSVSASQVRGVAWCGVAWRGVVCEM